MKKFFALTSGDVTDLEIANQQAVREKAGECMVILENDGTLPLTASQRKIALYGAGARSPRCGRWLVHEERRHLDARPARLCLPFMCTWCD